ncbi:MAG: hypothetical protein ACRDPI_04990, partial [Nocardioidaceae bacterium]
MSASRLVTEELQQSPTPSPPRPVIRVAGVGLLLSLAGTALMVWATLRLRDYNHGGVVSTVIGAVFVLATLYPFWPAVRSFAAARERTTLMRADQLVPARRAAAAGREEAQIAIGYAVAAILVALV